MTGEGSRIVVVKIGGSLLLWPQFPDRLQALLGGLGEDRPVLVVGGGRAADFVRELDSLHRIGDKQSHRLALRALDLTASVVASIVPALRVVTETRKMAEAFHDGLIPVFAPRSFLENIDSQGPNPLQASWDVTSDSIAARLAVHVGSQRLILLKSQGMGRSTSALDAARTGIVDPCFPAVSANIRLIELVNLRANPPTVETIESAKTT